MMPTLACVLKSGGEYKPEHVERLYRQVRDPGRWPPGRFVCLTDFTSVVNPLVRASDQRPLTRNWPGWWSKLELCAPEHDELGDILFLDLDTTVVGSLEDVASVDRLTLLDDFLRSGVLASGVMYLPVRKRRQAWEFLHMGAGPALVVQSFRRKGDAGFFNMIWRDEADRWQDVLPGQLVSYKLHVQPAENLIPWDARLVCHHGHPRPWEVVCDDVA